MKRLWGALTTLLFVSACASHSSRQPSGLFSNCHDAIELFFHNRALARLEVIRLSSQDLNALNSWVSETRTRLGTATLHEKLALYEFSKLPQNIRESLFLEGDKAITPEHLYLRLSQLDADHYGHPVLKLIPRAYDSARFAGKEAQDIRGLQSLIDRVLAEGPAAMAALERDIEWRAFESAHEALLLSHANPEYEIQVIGNSIRVPDGAMYPIERRLDDGTLLVKVRRENILVTQDYLNGAIVAEYRNDPKLGKDGFWGEMVADGRFFIMDQHHRTAAYADTHNGWVLVQIKPSEGGRYVAKTHLDVLQFYTHWSHVLPDERTRIYRAAEKSPIEAIRAKYYELMRRPALKIDPF